MSDFVRVLHKTSLLSESFAFVKSINSCCTTALYSDSFKLADEGRMCHPEHMYDVEAHSNTHAHTQINVTVISENNLKRYHESYNDSSRAIFIHVE